MDPSAIERITKDVWMSSHLSIARFAGGIKINGTDYFIDPRTEDLVRADVFRKEQKQRALARSKQKAAGGGGLFSEN